VVLLSSAAVIALGVRTLGGRYGAEPVPDLAPQLMSLIAIATVDGRTPAPLMPVIALDTQLHNPAASSAAPRVSVELDEEHRYDDLIPVVFLHGMGDAGSNPGMQSLCKTASERYPGLYVVCADVTNGLASITTPLAEQVDEFASFVRADERLARGFHGVGISQGGLVLRGFIEQSSAEICSRSSDLWVMARPPASPQPAWLR